MDIENITSLTITESIRGKKTTTIYTPDSTAGWFRRSGGGVFTAGEVEIEAARAMDAGARVVAVYA